MKLLVQSDDYGFTIRDHRRCVRRVKKRHHHLHGAVCQHAVRAVCVERIKDCPHVCFGIDINIVSGSRVRIRRTFPPSSTKTGNLCAPT